MNGKILKQILTYEEELVKTTASAIVGIYNPDNKGYGSGTHIGDGYILTNCHVISDEFRPARQVQIEWPEEGGTKKALSPGTTIFNVPSYDLAIVRDNERSNYSRPRLYLEHEDKVVQGTKVCAIGSPLMYFNTTTFGHVTATHRELNYYNVANKTRASLFQIDAAINPGNSGGACINYQGKLIGVPSAGIPMASNIGFVIKADSILEFIDELAVRRDIRVAIINAFAD